MSFSRMVVDSQLQYLLNSVTESAHFSFHSLRHSTGWRRYVSIYVPVRTSLPFHACDLNDPQHHALILILIRQVEKVLLPILRGSGEEASPHKIEER